MGANLSIVPHSAAPRPDHDAQSCADTTGSTGGHRTQSPNTRRAYEADWNRFVTWCTRHGQPPLPAQPAAVARYLRDAAAAGRPPLAPATVLRWASAIADRHRRSGYPPPTATAAVQTAVADIRAARALAERRAPRRAAPLMTTDIVTMVAFARKETLRWASEVYERRDSALLLIGYAGALGRTDLVELSRADVRVDPGQGLLVRVKSARGTPIMRRLPITETHDSCPACAAVRWAQTLAASEAGGRRALIRLLKTAEPFDRHVCTAAPPRSRADSPFFRSIRQNGNLCSTPLAGSSVHRMIRRRAQRAGFDDEFVAALGVHSLRAGFIIQAAGNGTPTAAILRQTGHAGPASLQRYLAAPPADDNPIDLGL